MFPISPPSPQMASSFLPAFYSATALLWANLHTRRRLLPVSYDTLETHVCTLLYVSAGATSASGYVHHGFKKSQQQPARFF